jgi:hypothetical protein
MLKSRTLAFAAVVSLLAVLSIASPASAGKKPHALAQVAGCTVSGNVVDATGLPEGVVVNFFVTDASGTYGWPLGLTFDGTGMWSVNVPDRTGPTTYEFASLTYGKDGSKYDVYASCSAS